MNSDQIAMLEALKHLQFATPRERNGPCHKAINVLRKALGFDPIKINGKALEDMKEIEKAVQARIQDLSQAPFSPRSRDSEA